MVWVCAIVIDYFGCCELPGLLIIELVGVMVVWGGLLGLLLVLYDFCGGLRLALLVGWFMVLVYWVWWLVCLGWVVWVLLFGLFVLVSMQVRWAWLC